MDAKGTPMDPPAEGRQGHIFLGPGPFPSAARGRLAFDPAGNPCATGGTHAMRIADGKVDRVIATGPEGAALSGSRPAGRTVMRACNQDGGAGIAVRARRPVRTRTVGGQEQIVYRTSEMDGGRLCAAELDGEHYALRKSGPNVEVFKFMPDGDVGGD